MAEKEYIGTIKKCPGCGNILESLVARCPNCGLELTGTGINSTIAAFASKIDNFDDMRGRYITFDPVIPIVRKLLLKCTDFPRWIINIIIPAMFFLTFSRLLNINFIDQKYILLWAVLISIAELFLLFKFRASINLYFLIFFMLTSFLNLHIHIILAIIIGIVACFLFLVISLILYSYWEDSKLYKRNNIFVDIYSIPVLSFLISSRYFLLEIIWAVLIGIAAFIIALIAEPDNLRKKLSSKPITTYKLGNFKWKQADDEKKQFIENFTIPNARADFLEFFIFAMVHIEPEPQVEYEKKWNEIWAAKCKQVYTKARISMAGEPELLDYMKQLAKESGFSL